mgnify:CR=1 FL=1
MKNTVKAQRKKSIFLFIGLVMLAAASITGFLSCSAGVNVGEANKVLTSFGIQWPEGFDNTCASGESINVTVLAFDQNGDMFNWDGLIDII